MEETNQFLRIPVLCCENQGCKLVSLGLSNNLKWDQKEILQPINQNCGLLNAKDSFRVTSWGLAFGAGELYLQPLPSSSKEHLGLPW